MRAAGGALALIGLCAIWLATSGSGASGHARSSAATDVHDRDGYGRSDGARARLGPAPGAAGGVADPADPAPLDIATAPIAALTAEALGAEPDSALATYLAESVYPPTSRPLSADSVDLIEWNRRFEDVRTSDTDSAVTYLFTADKSRVAGADSITATLSVWRDGEPAQAAITAAYWAPYRGGQTSFETAVPMTYEARDGIYVRTLGADELASIGGPAVVGLFVEFEADGARQRASLRFQYTPASAVPARFTGRFRDAAEDGSLAVYAEVEVMTPGAFVVDANLYDDADAPVAWTRTKAQLEAGVREVRLAFFGRAIAERGAGGRFRVAQLRGARFVPGQDPDLEQMPAAADEHVTAAYAADQFSDEPWDDPHKRARIQRLLQAEQNPGAPFVERGR